MSRGFKLDGTIDCSGAIICSSIIYCVVWTDKPAASTTWADKAPA